MLSRAETPDETLKAENMVVIFDSLQLVRNIFEHFENF